MTTNPGAVVVAAKITSVEEAKAWGQMAKDAAVIPMTMTPIQAAAIVQTGKELGLHPFQSLRSISFIKGKLCMSVQLQLALAKSKGVQTHKGWLKETDGSCTVTLTRGVEEVTCTYTLEDAKRAKLVIPDGNWDKYARQMLRWRAIGDALRLIAPDAVMGLLSPEEAESITEDGRAEDAGHQIKVKEIEIGVSASAAGHAYRGADIPAVPSVPKTPDMVGRDDNQEVNGVIAEGKGEPFPEEKPKAKPVEKFVAEKKGKFGFLDHMRVMRKALGDIRYYQILNDFKVQHANEIEDRDTMKLIYWKMKRIIDAEKEDQDLTEGINYE